jgi:hypothetical protein
MTSLTERVLDTIGQQKMIDDQQALAFRDAGLEYGLDFRVFDDEDGRPWLAISEAGQEKLRRRASGSAALARRVYASRDRSHESSIAKSLIGGLTV